MPSRVSIKDIAVLAGVSHPTVSRALRGSPLVKPETRLLIEKIAREQGYIPNAVAQSLQTRRTQTIGLVVASISDPYFAGLVEGVEEVALANGFSILINISHNDPDYEIRVVESFARRRVDGIIVAASRLSQNQAERVTNIRVPVVQINRHTEDQAADLRTVAVDDQRGAAVAVAHLLSLGHRRIGYLGLGNRFFSNRNRLSGYQQALTAAGLTPDPAWVIQAPPEQVEAVGDVEAARLNLPGLFAAGVTAVFCYNDLAAIGALLACRAAGRAVPGQMSLCGFDDIELASFVNPTLTTVHQPRREMGQQAMQVMLNLIHGRPVENISLVPSLVIRESTAAPHPAA